MKKPYISKFKQDDNDDYHDDEIEVAKRKDVNENS